MIATPGAALGGGVGGTGGIGFRAEDAMARAEETASQ